MLDYHTLEPFGLNSKEAKVYLANLELGPSPVQKIGQKAGIHRVSTYDILESLMKKGLVTQITKANKRYFVAENPEKLTRQLKDKEETLENLMPELMGIYNLSPQKPKVRFYEGKEGIRTILNQVLKVLKSEKDYLVYAPTELFHKTLPKIFPGYLKRRIELGVKTRLISLDSKMARERAKDDAKELRERRLLPSEFNFTTFILIYGNNVALLSLTGEMTGVVIEDKSLAQTHKKFFEFMWQHAKKVE